MFALGTLIASKFKNDHKAIGLTEQLPPLCGKPCIPTWIGFTRFWWDNKDNCKVGILFLFLFCGFFVILIVATVLLVLSEVIGIVEDLEIKIKEL